MKDLKSLQSEVVVVKMKSCFNFVYMYVCILYIVDKSTGFSEVVKVNENGVNARFVVYGNIL